MRTKSCLLSLTFALSLFGCGQQTFDVLQSQHQTDAPGGMDVPARVDILMVVDNTGSMHGKENFLGAQIRSQFLAKLDSQPWDYRFTVIPTTPSGTAPLGQIAGSKYSTNHSGATEPYPHAFSQPSSDHTIEPAHFVESRNFSLVLGANQSGAEPTMITVGDVMNNSQWQTKFFRPSAKAVIIVVSNGDDTSETNSTVYPYMPPSSVSSTLINRIKAVKPAAKFHSVVNVHAPSTNCLGGTYRPTRYMNASSQLSGRSYALCTPNGDFDTAFASVMSSLAADLQPIRFEYEQEFVVLPSRPAHGTVKVKKILPNGNVQILAENSAHGWSWVATPDQETTACEVTVPSYNRCKTGYSIRLNGSARAIGSEKIQVEYLAYGSNASVVY